MVLKSAQTADVTEGNPDGATGMIAMSAGQCIEQLLDVQVRPTKKESGVDKQVGCVIPAGGVL